MVNISDQNHTEASRSTPRGGKAKNVIAESTEAPLTNAETAANTVREMDSHTHLLVGGFCREETVNAATLWDEAIADVFLKTLR